MNYCSHCGQAVVFRVPDGDTLPRYICPDCGTIHYQNPKVVVGCVAEWEGRILLCRRAIEPRSGFWTLPAGFLENGETILQGARRETLEEARAEVDDVHFFSLLNVAHISQIHVFYRGQLVAGAFDAGHETLEARLFAEDQIPWEDLAFPTVRHTLDWFCQDRRRGQFGVHVHDVAVNAWKELGLTREHASDSD